MKIQKLILIESDAVNSALYINKDGKMGYRMPEDLKNDNKFYNLFLIENLDIKGRSIPLCAYHKEKVNILKEDARANLLKQTVASTDESDPFFPLISEEFLIHYVERYNQDNPIIYTTDEYTVLNGKLFPYEYKNNDEKKKIPEINQKAKFPKYKVGYSVVVLDGMGCNYVGIVYSVTQSSKIGDLESFIKDNKKRFDFDISYDILLSSDGVLCIDDNIDESLVFSSIKHAISSLGEKFEYKLMENQLEFNKFDKDFNVYNI
jgi:hypothetical protein